MAHLGVARDVVGHREQLLVHELLGAEHDGVAPRVAAREPRHKLGQRERALEIVHAADHPGRGAALGGRFLTGEQGRGQRCGDEREEDRDG